MKYPDWTKPFLRFVTPLRREPVLLQVAVFGVASAAGLLLLAGRIVVTGHARYHYLPWNLILAWVPFGLALLAARLAASPDRRRGALLLCGLGWLLFFPNAPYICTDLLHLARLRPEPLAPLWFDLLLNLTFALTGLLLGFASLALMQRLVGRIYGWATGWLFSVGSLALAGFGVYLGRFERWNSWDALFSPTSILADVAGFLTAPWQHPRTWGFSFVCFVFLFLGYLMCYCMANLHPAPANQTSITERNEPLTTHA